MKFRDRRLKSGWEEARVERRLSIRDGTTTLAPPEPSRERDEDRMTDQRRAYDAAHAARARARRAGSRHRRQPAGRLRAGRRRRRDRRRGLAPRRRNPARRGRRALEAASTRRRMPGLTAVVTLEPCNHTGRTGPCSVALLAAGVARVVYALSDPGHGPAEAPSTCAPAASRCSTGVLADEAEAFLHIVAHRGARGRPWVTVKWASTLDGRAAASDGTSQWITGTASRQRVHEEREASDAILVGTGTVLADDPSLTARGDAGELLAAPADPGRRRRARDSGGRGAAPASGRPDRDPQPRPRGDPRRPRRTADSAASTSRAARPWRARSSPRASPTSSRSTSPPPCWAATSSRSATSASRPSAGAPPAPHARSSSSATTCS